MRLIGLGVAAVLLVVSGIGLAAQGGVQKAQQELDAAVEKGDRAAYQRVLTDDFTWVNQAGRLRDKKTVVAEVQPADKATTEAIDVRAYAGGAVLIATRRNPGGIDVRFLRVWVLQGGQWKLAAHQGLPMTDQPVAAAANPSSPMPPSSGPAAEIKAIDQAISDLAAGNTKSDVRNFAASTTDGFVAIQGRGALASKQDRMAQLAKRPDGPGPAAEEISTRIYGDLAVTNRIVKGATGRSRQLIVHAKQGGRWLRAAIISTPIATGK